LLQDALRASKDSKQPIDLLVENAKFFKIYPISYHDGIRNPHLERTEASGPREMFWRNPEAAQAGTLVI